MPQLQALGRRWRVSTDGTLPVVCIFLMIFHLGVVIPVFIVFVASSSDYPCPEEGLVKSSILTTLGLNIVAMLHDATFIFVGCKGGPLEEHKRRHASFLVGTRVFLYFLTFAALIFSTVLIYLPSIQGSCYAGNPCTSKDIELREASCTGGSLTPSCALVYNTPQGEIVACRTSWFNLAASFAVEKYDPSTIRHYSGLQYSPSDDSSLCDVTYEALGEPFAQWQQETGQQFPPLAQGLSRVIDLNITNIASSWASEMGTAEFGSHSFTHSTNRVLPYLTLLSNACPPLLHPLPGYTIPTSPWNSCFEDDPVCYDMIMAASNCPVYNDLLFFWQESSDYSYALAAVWGSWAILLANVLIIVAAFNAFPDYNNRDSWKESVKSMARLMCCSKVLKHAKTEDGQDAAAGLGDLLFKLFGGIDLDYTDLLLGVYLVSERQSWRRFLYAKGRIEKLGKRVFVPQKMLRKAAEMAEGDPMSEDVEFDSPDDDTGLSFRQSVLDAVPLDKDSGETDETCQVTDGTPKMARVVVTYDSRPYLTPFDFSPLGSFEPEVDGHESVSMYVQTTHDETSSASRKIVEECIDLVYFAKASYGLQMKKWKDAKHDSVVSEVGDKCLACTPFLVGSAKRSHFTKRNFASILRYTKVEPHDVIHVSYTDTALGIIPYLIVLDRKANRVVISMRGTAHVADIVTDLLGHPKECAELLPAWVRDENGDKDPLEIHSGILSSALAVLRDLEENGILEALETTVEVPGLNGSSDGIIQDTTDIDHAMDALGLDDEVELPIERAKSILEECGKRDIPLVLTGHSLGAAVASVCAFELRSRFPQMRCVCFNPPGGVMSTALSKISEPFCTSFIVGSDIISRLNLQNVSRLIDDMVLALGRCRKSKLKVLLEIVFGRRRFRSNADTYYSPDEISPEVLEVLQQYIDTSMLHAQTIRQGRCNLLPPGKAMFLRPVAKNKDGGDEYDDNQWDVVPVDKEALLSEGILLTRQALDHHHLWCTLSAMMSCLGVESHEERID